MLIGLCLGNSSLNSSYAAAGSLVVRLVWVYYLAQIFLLGAEFNWLYAHEHGSRRGVVWPCQHPRHTALHTCQSKRQLKHALKTARAPPGSATGQWANCPA